MISRHRSPPKAMAVKQQIYCISILAFTLMNSGLPVSTPAMPSGTAYTVLPIEEAALDELMENKDGLLVINFMAAWCGPCIHELPVLNKLYRKYRNKGLQIIGISIDLGGPGKIQELIRSAEVEFPVFWYGEKAINKFGLNAIPMLLIVRQGQIHERLPGQRSEKFLDEKFQEILELD